MPQSEQRPSVGLTPTVAGNAAGWRVEPPVSVAVAPMQSCAGTADADPPHAPSGASVGMKALSERAASIAARCASVSSSEVKDLFARPFLASAIVIDVKFVIY